MTGKDIAVLSEVETEPISLGKTGRVFVGLDPLSLVERDLVGGLREVILTSNELTAFCPVTKQPDIYQITISFDPFEHSLETKSLKLYFETFRNIAIFAEDLAVKIATDIFDAIKPYYVLVILRQNVRGGITLTAKANKAMFPEDIDNDE